MKSVIFDTKNLDDALKQAQQELNVNKDKIKLNVLEEKKGLFGRNKQYKVEATIDVNPPIEGLNYLKQMLEDMKINALVEMRKKGNTDIQFVITSDDNSILIGKNGKTLEAMQILLRKIVNLYVEDEEEQYRVSVDCGGYKEQRKKQLEILATKTAMEVVKTKIPVSLDPMNAYERRIIHTKLAEWRDVTTESMGVEPKRHLVVKPKNK